MREVPDTVSAVEGHGAVATRSATKLSPSAAARVILHNNYGEAAGPVFTAVFRSRQLTRSCSDRRTPIWEQFDSVAVRRVATDIVRRLVDIDHVSDFPRDNAARVSVMAGLLLH